MLPPHRAVMATRNVERTYADAQHSVSGRDASAVRCDGEMHSTLDVEGEDSP